MIKYTKKILNLWKILGIISVVPSKVFYLVFFDLNPCMKKYNSWWSKFIYLFEKPSWSCEVIWHKYFYIMCYFLQFDQIWTKKVVLNSICLFDN